MVPVPVAGAECGRSEEAEIGAGPGDVDDLSVCDHVVGGADNARPGEGGPAERGLPARGKRRWRACGQRLGREALPGAVEVAGAGFELSVIPTLSYAAASDAYGAPVVGVPVPVAIAKMCIAVVPPAPAQDRQRDRGKGLAVGQRYRGEVNADRVGAE